MNPQEALAARSRRSFLRNCVAGMGTLGLAHLLSAEGRTGKSVPDFAPTAKNVIFLFMEGAPSQMDLFDPKPALQKWNGKPLPASLTKELKLAFIKPTASVL